MTENRSRKEIKQVNKGKFNCEGATHVYHDGKLRTVLKKADKKLNQNNE